MVEGGIAPTSAVFVPFVVAGVWGTRVISVNASSGVGPAGEAVGICGTEVLVTLGGTELVLETCEALEKSGMSSTIFSGMLTGAYPAIKAGVWTDVYAYSG